MGSLSERKRTGPRAGPEGDVDARERERPGACLGLARRGLGVRAGGVAGVLGGHHRERRDGGSGGRTRRAVKAAGRLLFLSLGTPVGAALGSTETQQAPPGRKKRQAKTPTRTGTVARTVDRGLVHSPPPRSRARSPPSPSRLRRASTAAPAHTLARVTPASQSANGPPRDLAPRPAPTAPRPPPSSPPTRASSRPRDVPRQSLRARDRPVASRTPRPHRPLAPPAAMPAETKPAEPPDMYAVLGVSSTATSTEIRRAYRNLITKARARRIDPRVVSRSPRARPLSFLPGASSAPSPPRTLTLPPSPPPLRATATPG